MNPEQWLSLKWNGGSTMSDRWLNQSKIIHLAVYLIVLAIDKELSIGNIIIHYQDLYYYIVLVLGYMVMAKCIRKE